MEIFQAIISIIVMGCFLLCIVAIFVVGAGSDKTNDDFNQ